MNEPIPERNESESVDFEKAPMFAMFKELTEQALEYKKLIDSSKTTLRKEYYKKKLEKLNKQAYKLLAEMSLYDKIKSEDV